MRKVIQKSIVFILVAVALANLADYIYASALTSAATSSLSMFATITPSMTVVIDDTNPTLNIIPSSNGTFDSASVNVSAYSNGSVGYTLTMTPSNTSLTGSSTGATIPTLQTGGYTSDTFPANYWGVSVDSGTYSPAAATNLITVSSSNPDIASNTHTVDLGVSLDLTAALDTYSTTLNFSATATTQTYPITFTFDSGITSLAIKDANNVTKATISTSGNSANLDFAGTYTIVPTYGTAYLPGTITLASGSGFVNSDTYTYTVGSNAGAVAVTSTPKIYMQNISQASLATLMPNVGDEVTLYDNRDEKPYTVAKLADGNYWMTQNLDHDIVAEANYYTPQNTDIPSAWTPSTATYATGDDTWIGSRTAPESYDPGDLCWDGELNWNNGGTLDTATTACGNDKHMHIGNFYNWTAAVAMNDSSSYTADGTDTDQSICPAGWRLPTDSGAKSFDNLWSYYSSSFDANTMMNSPLYFTYAGNWIGWNYVVGRHSVYWSSVVTDRDSAHGLFFEALWRVYPQAGDYRIYGSSVRCVAR